MKKYVIAVGSPFSDGGIRLLGLFTSEEYAQKYIDANVYAPIFQLDGQQKIVEVIVVEK